MNNYTTLINWLLVTSYATVGITLSCLSVLSTAGAIFTMIQQNYTISAWFVFLTMGTIALLIWWHKKLE